MQCKEAARDYIARGWSVVPVPPRSKGPTIRGWNKLRIDDPEAWFQDGDNIGIILGTASGMVCVDLDHPKAIELAQYFLPPTGLVCGRTRNPRVHWFYRVTGEIENKKHKLPKADIDGTKATVVEILGTGNQVIVGPSIHPSGDQYDLATGEPATVDGQSLQVAVAALYQAVLESLGMAPEAKREKVAGQQSGSTEDSPGTDYDQRGDVRQLLISHGWAPVFTSGPNEHWRRPGKEWGTSATLRDGKVFYVFSSSTSLDSGRAYGPFGLLAALEHDGDLTRAAAELGRQGYGKQLAISEAGTDISAIVNGPIKPVEQNQIGITTEEDDDFEPDEFGTEAGPFPQECLEPGGILGDVMRHCLSTSRYPQPELSLAAAICLLGTVTGRKVTDEFGTRTNLYILGLDETGTGKEHARQVNKEILTRCGYEKMHGSERVGSHAGIVNAVFEQPAVLMQLDEIGRLLATMKDPRKAPHLYNCITVLMQLYSSSGTIWKADAYADSKKVKTIDQPHLCVYGTATPDSFWHNLSTENIAEGLVGRLMIFQGRGYDVSMRKPSLVKAPDSLLSEIRWWIDYRPAGGGNLGIEHPTCEVVRHSSEAEQRFMSHVAAINERRKTESKTRAALWSRSAEKASKLALVHACSRGVTMPRAVEIQDVEWGIKLANWMTRRILAACVEHVSENDQEARAKRVLQLLTEKPLTLNQLSRKTQWLRGRERSEIITDLIACGLISTDKIWGKNGRPTTILKKKRK